MGLRHFAFQRGRQPGGLSATAARLPKVVLCLPEHCRVPGSANPESRPANGRRGPAASGTTGVEGPVKSGRTANTFGTKQPATARLAKRAPAIKNDRKRKMRNWLRRTALRCEPRFAGRQFPAKLAVGRFSSRKCPLAVLARRPGLLAYQQHFGPLHRLAFQLHQGLVGGGQRVRRHMRTQRHRGRDRQKLADVVLRDIGDRFDLPLHP